MVALMVTVSIQALVSLLAPHAFLARQVRKLDVIRLKQFPSRMIQSRYRELISNLRLQQILLRSRHFRLRFQYKKNSARS